MTVADQVAGLFLFAGVYVAGVALAAQGRRSWIRHLPTATRQQFGAASGRSISRIVALVFREFRSKAVWVWLVVVVVVCALLFAVQTSLAVEVLFVAAVAVLLALSDIQARAGESARIVADTSGRAYPLPQRWRAGVLLAHLGYFGVAAFLGGFVAVLLG